MVNYNYLNALSYYLRWRSHPQPNSSGVIASGRVNLDEAKLLADFLNENEAYNNYAHSALSYACEYTPANAGIQDVLNSAKSYLEFINTETPIAFVELYKEKEFMGVKNDAEVAEVKPKKAKKNEVSDL